MIFCSSIQEATLSIMLRILHVSTFWKVFLKEVNYSQLKKSGCKLSFNFAGKLRPSLRLSFATSMKHSVWMQKRFHIEHPLPQKKRN